MKFVIIKDMSAGNESVGEMWKETFIFDENKTLKEVYSEITKELYDNSKITATRKNYTLTVATECDVK